MLSVKTPSNPNALKLANPEKSPLVYSLGVTAAPTHSKIYRVSPREEGGFTFPSKE